MNELLDKAKAGDIEAFSKLITSLEKDLEKIAASKLKDKSYVNDVLQNVYYKAYMKLYTLEDNKKFKSWIFTVLKNECINVNKSIARRKEVSLESFNDVLENSLNYSYESDTNFEQMIEKLSDEEKKLLRMKFQENFSNIEISEELGIPYNTVKSKISRAIKKITLVVLILMIFSGFTVLATYIIKQIRAHFTMSSNAINTAVENNYVQEIDSDFVYDNGIGIKVDAIVLDDKNLDISFVYDVQDKEKYGEITGIRLNDYVIKSGDEIFNKIDKDNQILIERTKQNSKSVDKFNSQLRNSILFSTTNKFPNIDNINIQINSITINSNYTNQYYEIQGNWNLSQNITEKLNERSKIAYFMEDNVYAKNAEVILTDTIIRFDIEFNLRFDYSEMLGIYLYNDNNKFSWIDKKFSVEKSKLIVSFDVSKYNDNIDELIMKIPRKNEEDILIKFRRDQ